MPSIRLLTMLAACGRIPGNIDARVNADFDQGDYTPDAISQHPLDLVPVLSYPVARGTPLTGRLLMSRGKNLAKRVEQERVG